MGKNMNVRCNETRVVLSYYSSDTTYLFSALVSGSGEGIIPLKHMNDSEKYRAVEETALAYLLRDALRKARGKKLVKIVGITPDDSFNPTPNGKCVEIEILLEGVAVYN